MDNTKRMLRKAGVCYLTLTLIALVIETDVRGQSGGSFEIKQSVVANGGGESNGGVFSLAGTTGQVTVGSSSGSPYQVRNGFWQGNLGPTASFVSVSGRVTTANGNGIRNASISLVDSNGTVHRSLTASFGYYRFDDIEVGQNVVITIAAKRYTFAVATRIIAVQDDLADIDFIAEP
jgi:hypothetical protein